MVFFSFCAISVKAQYKFPRVDASVMDEAYYPSGAAYGKIPFKVRVIYSRPLKKGRDIFSATGLQPYGKVWRLGANESTEIKFYVPVTVGGKQIPAGSYSMYAIPDKDSWTIIINSVTDRWGINGDGSTTEDPAKDVVRTVVPVKALDAEVEAMAMVFTDRPDGANLVIGWDKTAVELPILFAK
ncbi:MAG: asparagine synthetase [Chitinophagaceae bacterium]|nr:asparagine synthetase [Chitinophagaceae bacterium]